jgi:uncharacterized membrane-anchored protein YjiN (DUF445 family)
MALDIDNINWDGLTEEAVNVIKDEFTEFAKELKNSRDKEIAQQAAENLAKELFELLKCDKEDKEKIDDITEKILLCKGTLTTMSSIVGLQIYQKIVSTVGIVVGNLINTLNE